MTEKPSRPGLFIAILARLKGIAAAGMMRGMLTLALGAGTGRFISFAMIPIVTRLYTPEDFGVLSVFTAFVLLLAPLATLRYALALPLPRQDGTAMNLLVLSAALLLALTTMLTLVLAAWAEPILTLVSMQALLPWWWLIPIAVLGSAAYEMLTMWATPAALRRETS